MARSESSQSGKSSIQLNISGSLEEYIFVLLEENRRLQAMLEAASKEARKDKKKLEALNYFTSHIARATVARIWGLAAVLYNATSCEEVKQLTTHLQHEANELNNIIHEASEKMNGTKD